MECFDLAGFGGRPQGLWCDADHSRNGYARKTVLTDPGRLGITVPRGWVQATKLE